MSLCRQSPLHQTARQLGVGDSTDEELMIAQHRAALISSLARQRHTGA